MMSSWITVMAYVVAAVGEIGGCYAAWVWLREGRSAAWLLPGAVALAVFAVALTFVDTGHAGRAFAAYGGVYITASLGWLWLVEGVRPDRWDLVGLALCLMGAATILFPHRTPAG